MHAYACTRVGMRSTVYLCPGWSSGKSGPVPVHRELCCVCFGMFRSCPKTGALCAGERGSVRVLPVSIKLCLIAMGFSIV